MYDTFDIETNYDINRESKTSRYVLKGKDDNIRIPIIAKHDSNYNFIILNDNLTDKAYILNSDNPSIDNNVKYLINNSSPTNNYDIVFISNGESRAQAHYDLLVSLDLPNKIHWVKDVDGRNNAYWQAARVSETDYFFAVFAKIEVNPLFDFSFGCEQWDQRHYVFHAKNPVNNLCYGHQGVILYNKKAVLENPGTAIDFTMAQLFREIPIVSGVAHYNTDSFSTWKTSFREVIKLLGQDDERSKERLSVWFTGTGPYADESIKGALDAKEFYYSGQDLLLSYDWKWLKEYYNSKYTA